MTRVAEAMAPLLAELRALMCGRLTTMQQPQQQRRMRCSECGAAEHGGRACRWAVRP